MDTITVARTRIATGENLDRMMDVCAPLRELLTSGTMNDDHEVVFPVPEGNGGGRIEVSLQISQGFPLLDVSYVGHDMRVSFSHAAGDSGETVRITTDSKLKVGSMLEDVLDDGKTAGTIVLMPFKASNGAVFPSRLTNLESKVMGGKWILDGHVWGDFHDQALQRENLRKAA